MYKINFTQPVHVHFIGIGGISMSGLAEILLKEGEKKSYTKVHCFADLSTRKHYPGTHSIALIINGIECEKLDFELVR